MQSGKLVLMVALASLNGLAAGGEASTQALGVIWGDSVVRLNHQPLTPGRAIFYGRDVVETGKGSTAVMRFRSGASVTLAENGEVSLAGDSKQVDLDLRRGALVLRTEGAHALRVALPDASVIVEEEGGFPAVCRIAAVGHSAAIFNDHGRVEIHGAGAPLILRPGQSAQLEAGRPQGGQTVPTVSAIIPVASVEPPSPPHQLNLNDQLNWGDTVTTAKIGRVRIEMPDHSFLNVGARSTMHITSYIPATQQTKVELTVGRMRGEVVKLKPGGSFEVRTQTAVIGVVGTVFTVSATAKTTQACGIENEISVQSTNPSFTKKVLLGAGQCVTVPFGAEPGNAVTARPGQIQNEVNLTKVAPRVLAVANPALTLGNVGAFAGSAGLSGLGITRLDSAKSSLNSATSNLNSAQAAGNAAVVAANSATANGNALNNATGIFITAVSPVLPCACQ